MNKKEAGFTLIEVLVVTIIFGLVMVVGTMIYFQIVQEYNRSHIRNEVRQNAERIMSDIGADIRASGYYQYFENVDQGPLGITHNLVLYKGDRTTINRFYFWWGGNIYKGITQEDIANKPPLLGDGLAAYDLINCSDSADSTYKGLKVEPTSGSGPVKITLTIQQTPGPTRSDFCGKVTITDTFYPRNAP